MLTPHLNDDSVTFPDDDGQTTVSSWITPDGADDTPEWARDAVHVQIDTDDENFRGIVVHLNDGPPIYQGNPEVHESAAEVLRQVRAALTRDLTPTQRIGAALEAIERSGVIL